MIVSAGYSPSVLRLLEDMNDYDLYDVLADLAYGLSPRTREDRTLAFRYKHVVVAGRPARRRRGRPSRRSPTSSRIGGTEGLENPHIWQTPEVSRRRRPQGARRRPVSRRRSCRRPRRGCSPHEDRPPSAGARSPRSMGQSPPGSTYNRDEAGRATLLNAPAEFGERYTRRVQGLRHSSQRADLQPGTSAYIMHSVWRIRGCRQPGGTAVSAICSAGTSSITAVAAISRLATVCGSTDPAIPVVPDWTS